MANDESFLDRIGDIYDASLKAEVWPNLLHQLSDDLDAHSLHLFIVDAESKEPRFASVSPRFPWEAMVEFHLYYHTKDPRILAGWSKPAGVLYPDTSLVPAEVFEKSEFYNDFYSRYGVRWMLGGLLEKTASTITGFAIVRTPKQGAFDGDDMKRAMLLAPHLTRALQVQQRLTTLESGEKLADHALDRLAQGVILLDGGGRPVFMNRAAQEIVLDADGLTAGKDGLNGARPDQTTALRAVIAGALGGGAGGAMTLARPSMKRPLQVLVAPLPPNRTAFGDNHAGAAVFVSDPERAPELPAEALARLYGLTPAEAKVAAALAAGQTVREIAERAQITEHTVRWALKQLFAKTATKRQAELVKLLLSGLASLAAGPRSELH